MSRNLLHRQRSECQEEKNFVSRVEEGVVQSNCAAGYVDYTVTIHLTIVSGY